jgi:bifunctional non-homologous end joining protein LigD
MAKPKFSHVDKVFWPREGYTKGDVIAYYDRMAGVILPYLRHRPLVLVRHPNGVKGESFFQKNVDTRHLPKFSSSVSVRARSTGRNVHYVVCNNKATLLFLANLGCIEFHPWNSRTSRLNHPDFLTIDLDPAGSSFADVVTVAREVRSIIVSAGGTCFVKTSGKSGLHVCVPLRGDFSFVEVRRTAKLICQLVNQRLPNLTRFAHRSNGREKRVYLDYSRNGVGQTIVAPYALRATTGATVSTPLAWSELTKRMLPTRYTIRTIFLRLKRKGDLWRGVARQGVNLLRLSKHLAHLGGK